MKQYQVMFAEAGSEGEATSRVLDRILAGERDEAALCEGLHPGLAMIIEAILAGLDDPSTLSDLLAAEPDESA